jgi:hypothetical protein
MKISDTTTRTVTIALEGAEIADIKAICRGFIESGMTYSISASAVGTAKNILKSLEVD